MSKQLTCPSARCYDKGSILVITLWTLCLLTVLTVYLGAGIRQKFIFVNRFEELSSLHFIAEAGVKKAIVEVTKDPDKGYGSLKDSWSNNPGVFKDIKIDNGSFSIYYDYMDELSGLRKIGYGLVDEESKINIDHMDRHVLRRLFKTVLNFGDTEAQELAASIVDWRDNDSLLSIPLGSAEDSYYRSRPHAYEAKDAPFDILDEVVLVKDMDMETFNRIKNYITIYGSGRININTASKEVLLSLGLNRLLVDKILFFRRGEDGIPSTRDDNAFKTVPEILPKLSQFLPLSDSEAALFSGIINKYLTTNSTAFMANISARLDTGGDTEIMTVIDRSGNVLYWRDF